MKVGRVADAFAGGYGRGSCLALAREMRPSQVRQATWPRTSSVTRSWATPAGQQWLLRHKRFHFHFTPTYGSWMTPVERWFSALTTKKLQRSAHRSVKALTADIRDWVKSWNEDPKPFVWHKTADEILDRLAGYCAAINEK